MADDQSLSYRHCECGWDGLASDCPKNPSFGFCRCPRCGAMVGTGLAIGRRVVAPSLSIGTPGSPRPPSRSETRSDIPAK